MRRSLLATVPLLMVLLPAPAFAITGKQIVTNAVDGFVRPAYAKLGERSSAMKAAMQTLCKAPSQETLDAAHKSFADIVEAWSEAETIRFGPVTEHNRLERMLFWPDRKGTGLRQVQAALADKDVTATKAETLAQKSVAMQGLGALEFVLYGTGYETLSAPSDPYRCSYGEAIAGNMTSIAREISDAWAKPDGFAATWSQPGADNPLYRNSTEAVTTLLEVFVNGTELVRDVRVGGFLGEVPKDDKPRQALFWRSGQTVPALKANIEGMSALYQASHFGEALPAEMSWIDNSVRFEFGNAVRAADGAQGPLADVLANGQERGKLAYFKVVTSSLSELFGTRLSGALGLTAGFSSLDGD
ncbi:imelysin family protein [Oryzicola mucosus]|uniref:Peptidase M75, Imelysin n=1 Tax=Oryzicola mucosus TaxID=2767425 RepID=A0A8J6PLX8_9HYPH|nr:imelysin family protein [Oryzicola mucosus]MBD0413565.1 peptidase M75, Imelysin [Oryzicola mucosus]